MKKQTNLNCDFMIDDAQEMQLITGRANKIYSGSSYNHYRDVIKILFVAFILAAAMVSSIYILTHPRHDGKTLQIGE